MYGKHPYYDTPRDQHRDAWLDEIDASEALRISAERGTVRGVRVDDDGTVQHYRGVMA